MSEIISYRDLVCWQKAIDLVLLVYEITGKYPADERFGLTAHTRKILCGSIISRHPSAS